MKVLRWLVSFVVGFAGFGALLYLRAPDAPGQQPESPLAAVLLVPEGYERLPDEVAGGGRLDEARAGRLLSVPAIPGFQDGLLRSWGRPRGKTPRAVVVLAVQLATPADAAALFGRYRGVAQSPDLEEFETREGWVGFHQRENGRFAQRVAFASGSRVFVVSVVTPKHESSTREVRALADRQAAAS